MILFFNTCTQHILVQSHVYLLRGKAPQISWPRAIINQFSESLGWISQARPGLVWISVQNPFQLKALLTAAPLFNLGRVIPR